VRDWNRFPTPPIWRTAPRAAAAFRLWSLWGALVVWVATEEYACFGPRPDVPGVPMDGHAYWTWRTNAEWRRGAIAMAQDALGLDRWQAGAARRRA